MGKKKGGQPSGWEKLVESVQADDGLPTRDSGYWAEDKLWHWNRYVEITTQAMVGKLTWPGGVIYVDLFCGPGVCVIRDNQRRIPGSPLIAANAPKPFKKILLCELDDARAAACKQRLSKRLDADRFVVFNRDCNSVIEELCTHIPNGAPTVAFLDPTGLDVDFQTVTTLSTRGAVDLLILFPDAVDILRNATHLYWDDPESRLDRVLGPGSNWRERRKELGSSDAAAHRKLFSQIYREQLAAHAGYAFFDELIIRGPHGPLYRLIYACKKQIGLDFWLASVSRKLNGQRHLPF
ncbi:MAG TPA: three-Cys-motif partner protein TcmP [Caulifigura sp.]|nr:three-Cys-motif partner protein TcmP [Caulifigura sp.]